MKNVLIVLATVITAVFAAGSIRLENPEYCGNSTDNMLQYDDGTPYWIWYGGIHYGTWFDTDDFMTGSGGIECQFIEFWFYHHTSIPWELDDFYAELWNADELFTSPVLLDQSDITAIHYTFVCNNYATPITTERDFWVIANVERTTNGSPTPQSDNTDNFTGLSHSFMDGVPIQQSGHPVDFLFRADGWPTGAILNSESWGAIKGLYR